MRKNRISLTNVISFSTLLIVIVVFAITSGGKTLTPGNMLSVIDQSFTVMIGGMGMIFVLSHGGIDLAIGSNACLAAFIAGRYAASYGVVPTVLTAVAVATAFGILSGIVVAVFKVPSFMVTVAMQTGLRGIVNFAASHSKAVLAPQAVHNFNNMAIKIPFVLILLLVSGYVFEYTKIGKYSKAVGENELCSRISGINVIKIKIIDFAISGAMSGFIGFFMMARTGGVSNMLGKGLEMKVILALLLGGVPVVGGMDSKMYKVIIGSLTVLMLENGLSVSGITGGTYQIIEGVMLVIVCVLVAFVKRETAIRDEKNLMKLNEVTQSSTETAA